MAKYNLKPVTLSLLAIMSHHPIKPNSFSDETFSCIASKRTLHAPSATASMSQNNHWFDHQLTISPCPFEGKCTNERATITVNVGSSCRSWNSQYATSCKSECSFHASENRRAFVWVKNEWIPVCVPAYVPWIIIWWNEYECKLKWLSSVLRQCNRIFCHFSNICQFFSWWVARPYNKRSHSSNIPFPLITYQGRLYDRGCSQDARLAQARCVDVD